MSIRIRALCFAFVCFFLCSVCTAQSWGASAGTLSDFEGAGPTLVESYPNLYYITSGHLQSSAAIFVSSNNGGTWGFYRAILLYGGPSINSAAMIALNGNLYVAFISQNPQSGVCMTTVTPSSDWLVDGCNLVLTGSSVQNAPSLTKYQGLLYLAASRVDGAIGISTSSDGVNWSPFNFIQGVVTDRGPQLSAPNGLSHMYLTWSYHNQLYWLGSTGNTWSCCGVPFLQPAPITALSSFAYVNGNFALAFVTNNTQLWYAVSRDTGYTWSNATHILSNTTAQSAPSLINCQNHFCLAFSNNGQLYFAVTT